jgi:hypothetical protein
MSIINLINEINGKVDSISNNIITLLALLHTNSVIENTFTSHVHNGFTIWCYANATDANAHNKINHIRKFTYTVTYDVNGDPTMIKNTRDL